MSEKERKMVPKYGNKESEGKHTLEEIVRESVTEESSWEGTFAKGQRENDSQWKDNFCQTEMRKKDNWEKEYDSVIEE